MRRLSLAIAATLAVACTPRQGIEDMVLNDQVVRRADIAYAAGPRQRLDVYRDVRTRRPAPVLIFFFGGRWKYGSKRDYLLLGSALARRGYVVVIPDSRLFPASLFPSWIVDAADAVRWTRTNIGRFGGDSGNIVVMGHSAGAHTVALLALDARYFRDVGLPRDAVKGYVSLAGPVDTIWTAPDVQELMGPRDGWPNTYPYTFVDGTAPPLLLLHGERDSVVTAGNSIRLAQRIRTRGGCVKLQVYPGIGHIQIALALTFPALELAPVTRDVVEFLKNPSGACVG